MSLPQLLLPLILTALLQGGILALHGKFPRWARAASALLCMLVALRYVEWRITETVPEGQSPLQQFWAWTFLAFEMATILSSALTQFFMSRHRDRTADANARQDSPLLDAPVDVFIATYNEPYNVLERTIVGALAIRHKDLRVWVLDDGARDWVRKLADEAGAKYLCRVKGEHAKAGNVNNGLALALRTARRPEFVLLLDADFVPHTNILKRTLGLFEEKDVGIVQTPQHFFNADPVQTNLLCSKIWPDEQRFFFSVLLPCKDAWGAAFCCGTSAVFRVAALEACGGMATETVTEDMLTSFRMEEHGFRTIFLNEPLSVGLAPEGLKEYVTQRSRWCLGAIQQIYTRWSFFGSARLRLISRISFFDGILYWTTNPAFKLMVLTGPFIYWATGTAVIRAETQDLMFALAPMVCCNLMFMSFFGRNRVMPIITDVAHLLSAFAIVRTVGHGLVKPRGHAFKVTAKGVSSDSVTVQWRIFLPFAGLAWLTLAGMLWNIRSGSLLNGTTGYGMNVIWSLFSVATFSITALATVELPKRRKEERFASGEEAELHFAGVTYTCTVVDISISGALLSLPEGWSAGDGEGSLVLDDGRLKLPLRSTRSVGEKIAVQFSDHTETRRTLIKKLFTGDYGNEVEEIRIPRVLLSVLKTLFA